MSLTTFTVCCDWPGCNAQRTFHHVCSPRDFQWAFKWGTSSYNPVGLDHLCPEHRFKTWEELEAAREAAADQASQGPA